MLNHRNNVFDHVLDKDNQEDKNQAKIQIEFRIELFYTNYNRDGSKTAVAFTNHTTSDGNGGTVQHFDDISQWDLRPIKSFKKLFSFPKSFNVSINSVGYDMRHYVKRNF